MALLRARSRWRVALRSCSTFPNANCSVPRARSLQRLIAFKARELRIKKTSWPSGKSRQNMDIKLFTIGFTQKSAREFFTALKEAGVKRVVDVRLNNNSQLAAFSKKEDLAYFLKEIAGIDYVHLPKLAPTQDILDAYKKDKGDWSVYERKFLDLIARREVEKKLKPELVQHGCLLCSEHLPHHCHRRLVAEYLNAKWRGIETKHLV